MQTRQAEHLSRQAPDEAANLTSAPDTGDIVARRLDRGVLRLTLNSPANRNTLSEAMMVALSRKVGRKHAMEMLLTGEAISAEKAEAIGLVNRAVGDDSVDGEVTALARKIAGKSQMTLKTGKQAFYAQAEMPLKQAYDFTVDVMIDNILKADAQEGVAAFLEKRQPDWRDE